MNWTECVDLMEYAGVRSRFDWPTGGINQFDCSEVLTISDLIGSVGWFWTWPGDVLLTAPAVQTFLELPSQTAIGHPFSHLFPFLTVFLVAVTLSVVFLGATLLFFLAAWLLGLASDVSDFLRARRGR